MAGTHVRVSLSEVESKNAAFGLVDMTNLLDIAGRKELDTPLDTATGRGDAAIVSMYSISVTAGTTAWRLSTAP